LRNNVLDNAFYVPDHGNDGEIGRPARTEDSTHPADRRITESGGRPNRYRKIRNKLHHPDAMNRQRTMSFRDCSSIRSPAMKASPASAVPTFTPHPTQNVIPRGKLFLQVGQVRPPSFFPAAGRLFFVPHHRQGVPLDLAVIAKTVPHSSHFTFVGMARSPRFAVQSA
jgi:hypothetical protein